MTNLIVKDNIKIEDLIYEIRGKQVMLDSDLAVLYGCRNGTKSINLAVKRHINRFPERFCFKLTEEESKNFWFQVETKKDNIETREGKYNSQYSNISTFIHNGFHDRFIILDKNILYHCGASFKDLGVKCFAINRVDNPFLLDNILSYLKN